MDSVSEQSKKTHDKPHDEKEKWKFQGLSNEWQEFSLCLLFHMLLPLLPLLLELWQAGTIKEKEISLATSMYAISIGASSKSKLIFALGIIISIAFASAYGFQNAPAQNGTPITLARVTLFSGISILLIFIVHFCERYNRHVVDAQPFWEF